MAAQKYGKKYECGGPHNALWPPKLILTKITAPDQAPESGILAIRL